MHADLSSRTGRAGAALVAALALVLAFPRQASAGLIPGIPDVVYDPVNYVSAVARYKQLYQQAQGQIRQIEYAYDQARQLREDARGWGRFRLSDFGGIVRQVGRTMGDGIALGYGNPQLGAIFRRQFPRVPRVADGLPLAHADQMNSIRDLAFAAVMSAQAQGTQIDMASQVLQQLRQGVVSASTERQLQQAQAAVQSFQAEQDLLTQHTLLSLSQQLATANAREAQRQMEEEVRGTEADARWRAWEQTVVGEYGDNLSARDRSLQAIRRRAGLPGAAVRGGERRDPRDIPAGTVAGTAWDYGTPAHPGGGAGAAAGSLGGTAGGAGVRRWDPSSIQGGVADPVDPWNPENGGQAIFGETNAPAAGAGTRARPGSGGGGGSGAARPAGVAPAEKQ